MWKLAAAVVEIALRRRGPDSLPDSTFLVVFLLGVYLLVALLTSLVLAGGLGANSLVRLAVDTALFFAFIYATLSFFKLERRYRQTVSAMLGVGIFINLAFLPFGGAGRVLGFEILDSPFVWFGVAFEIWSIFIAAWILARSLGQPLIVGFMFEILFLLTSFSIGEMLTPPAEQLTEGAG